MTETIFVPHRLVEFAAEHFQPLLGKKLAFLPPATETMAAAMPREAVELTLHSVNIARFPGIRGKRQPFSMLLTLRGAPPLDDRHLHTLSHPEFEPCELLLSRVTVPELDRHDGTMYYELVFG